MISFNRIPSKHRLWFVLLGIVGLSGTAGLSFSRLGVFDSVWLIMAVTFVTLLVLSLIFFVCFRLWKKKKGNALSKLLRKDAGSVELSGIESIRTNFENGIDKLRKANRNVYDLPWFLLAGQAGAGKTEAIRRSHAKEDFPPGLNDLMQGVGGTLNMNWWFTNKGIILDTAGRIFEERVQAGQNNEWQEFLRMLKKARKNMPINGFILAIPADSLIRDDFSKIEEKASHIAEQITLVQNVLGVRFPVFILITKADYIPGFREFVENIADPQLQQQMLGWSNPGGLDDPFEAEKVEEYLDGVVKKLKKRRLTHLLDPRPQSRKRLDDLDALFTFPNQLRTALPNLKRYIEIVFSLNPWTQKPLFIRGIYFTSSLQQGDALDDAIAEVMGKNLKEMALSSFKKEVPLFLRDVFFQKIYREQGLVTSASKVKGSMRRSRLLFAGACLVGVGLILAASWFGSRSFGTNIGDEYAHWKFAEEEYQESELKPGQLDWTRPIVYDKGVGDEFASDKNIKFNFSNRKYTLPEYLGRLANYTQKELEIPAVFRPLKFFDDLLTGETLDRETAFRRIYADAVILPVLENAKVKLRITDEATWSDRSAAGLNSLIQLQVLLNQEARGADYPTKFWTELNNLFFYLTEEELGAELERAYSQFFTSDYVELTGWPNESLSPHYARVDDFNDPRLAAISHGLGLWVDEIGEVRVQQEKNMSELEKKLEKIESVGKLENELLSKGISQGKLDRASINGLDLQFSSFMESLNDLLGSNQTFSFGVYYQEQINTAKRSVEEQVSALSAKVREMPSGGGELSRAVLERVDQKRKELLDSFDEIVTPEVLRRFGKADQRYLDQDQGMRSRLDFYHSLLAYRDELQSASLSKWTEAHSSIVDMQKQREELLAPIKSYGGHQEANLAKLKELADLGFDQASTRLYSEYCSLLRGDVRQIIGFPVFIDSDRVMTREELDALGQNLQVVEEDILKVKGVMQGRDTETLDVMLGSLRKIDDFREDLESDGALSGELALDFRALQKLDGRLQESIFWRARIVEIPTGGGPVRMKIDKNVSLGKVSVSDQNMDLLFTSTIDALERQPGDVGRLRVDGGWAPLRLLLQGGGKISETETGGYVYSDKIRSGTGGESFAFQLLIKAPKLPPLGDWLRSSDLKGL